MAFARKRRVSSRKYALEPLVTMGRRVVVPGVVTYSSAISPAENELIQRMPWSCWQPRGRREVVPNVMTYSSAIMTIYLSVAALADLRLPVFGSQVLFSNPFTSEGLGVQPTTTSWRSRSGTRRQASRPGIVSGGLFRAITSAKG